MMEPTPLATKTFTSTLHGLFRIIQRVLKRYSLVLFKMLAPALQEVKSISVTNLDGNDV
jgi:hypothetical protein